MRDFNNMLPRFFRRSMPFLCSAVLLLLLGVPAQATVFVEGNVKGFTSDGSYDLEIEVRNLSKPAFPKISRLTIRLAKVEVSDSHFKVQVDAGLEEAALSNISLVVRARPDDGQAVFLPAEVTSVNI